MIHRSQHLSTFGALARDSRMDALCPATGGGQIFAKTEPGNYLPGRVPPSGSGLG